MLLKKQLDAVSICLPDNKHFDVVEAAVAADKHILLEKPLAFDLEDGKKICNLVEDSNCIFMVGHILRFDPRFTRAKKYITEGKLGQIVHLNLRRNSPVTGPLHYQGVSDLSKHVMIHDVDIINWFLKSRPVKVFAKSRQVVLKCYDMTDTIFAFLEYEGGELACLEASWILPEKSPTIIDDKVEIVGSEGTLYIDSCDQGVKLVSDSLIRYPDSRHFPEINGEIGGALFEEINSFVNCIVNEQKPIINAHDALLALEVVTAIDKSIKQGCEIDI